MRYLKNKYAVILTLLLVVVISGVVLAQPDPKPQVKAAHTSVKKVAQTESVQTPAPQTTQTAPATTQTTTASTTTPAATPVTPVSSCTADDQSKLNVYRSDLAGWKAYRTSQGMNADENNPINLQAHQLSQNISYEESLGCV